MNGTREDTGGTPSHPIKETGQPVIFCGSAAQVLQPEAPLYAKAACNRFWFGLTIGFFMKLLDRYIGREMLFTTLFGVSVMTFVLVLGNLFKQLLDVMINHAVPFELIMSWVAFIIPFSLTYTIPWGFVTAVLLVFGKLSAENELVAMKSSGVSITRISAPVAVLALVCVGICLWINLVIAPHAQNNAKNAMVRVATQDPMSLFEGDHIISEFPGKKIYVEGKNGSELKNILVYDLGKDSSVLRVLFAKRGELRTNDESVLLHIFDARVEQHDPDAPGDLEKIREGITMRESVFPIPLKELYEKYGRLRVPSQKSTSELWSDEKTLRSWPQNDTTRSMISTTLTEINKRYSLSLASFALALIAIPFAITAHRKETSIGFLFSIIVAFGYFFFMQLAIMAQDKPKLHPELLIWLPNVVFILFGGCLFWKLSRQ